MAETGRFRSWVFTINNPTSTDTFSVNSLLNKPDITYGIASNEVGKEGTPHIQGYFNRDNAVSFAWVTHRLSRARISKAGGDDFHNKTYISKEGDVFNEVGIPVRKEQGKRNDIRLVTDRIRNKELSLEDLMFEYPELYLRYGRGFKEMINMTYKPRTDPPTVYWIWGKSGTGKTLEATSSRESHYIKDNTIWWDGYKQEEAIIIDDFDNQIPFRTLLRLLDRYKYQGQVKGGYININSPYIYITCEFPPENYWQGNELTQVTRRITSVQQL